MADLTDLTLLEAGRALRRGEFSSRELTLACLERIDSLEPQLKSFITLTPELALEQADEADRRLAELRSSGSSSQPPAPSPEDTSPPTPLPSASLRGRSAVHSVERGGEASTANQQSTISNQQFLGVPIAVKDVLCLAGVRCTAGSRILENFIPPYHATAVERLLAAGVVVLGKTNTDEFAMGSSTENSGYHTTHNPWDLTRVPGGSSGGSAAAVAAHMVPAALGTDTGGSVRQPASYCGVTGLKPTYGRVSRYGLIAYGSSLDTAGVLARDARDAAALFMAMAGPDPLDATARPVPLPHIDFSQPPNLVGLRVGVPNEYFISGIQPEVEQAVRAAIQILQELGVEVHPVSLPHTEYALPVYYLIAPAEASANLARFDGVRYGRREKAETLLDLYTRTRGQRFGAEVKRRIMLGTYALSAGYYEAYYAQAQKVRTLIRQDFEQAFSRVDVIAAPVAPTTAFRIGEHTDNPLSMYLEDVFTLPANLAGVPGLAFPVGFDQQGLPIGIQLMANHFREDVLFRIADAYQQVTDWHKEKPKIENREPRTENRKNEPGEGGG